MGEDLSWLSFNGCPYVDSSVREDRFNEPALYASGVHPSAIARLKEMYLSVPDAKERIEDICKRADSKEGLPKEEVNMLNEGPVGYGKRAKEKNPLVGVMQKSFSERKHVYCRSRAPRR